ncbi:5'-3' exonuclease [Saliterribacillus persicus]|uniref:5'-3' exonuclease n=1 Tax=Saliterribacillus persicus TaxID=930114 RepID=A0A368X741_9BACI|nr:5'-3' exonuclease [Saliterribacillus persicus]RCW63763.1 5'-3' exonuclease [Saliterribacillus persicus]
MNKNRVLLIDGMALLFRGFYATAFKGNFMVNSKGIPRNGIFGFLNYFTDAIETFEPTHVISCWDMGSKTFRNDIYPDYKANRTNPPEELVPQFDLCKEVVDAFQTPNIGLTHFEADDCIGTIAQDLSLDNEVVIVSGDLDLLQLVDKNTSVAIMKKGTGNYEVFTEDNFYEKKELEPKQIIDLKGLMGDSADNYPGVKGVGEKTAIKLLKEFHSIDNILLNTGKLPLGLQKKLATSSEILALSRNLATIKKDVPLTYSLEQAMWNFNYHVTNDYLVNQLEFSNTDRWLKKLAVN